MRAVSTLPRDDLLRCLRAVSDPTRLRILDLLALAAGPRLGPLGDGEPGLCLSDLQTRLGLQHALVSHHVGVLRRAGLVMSLRRGRWAVLRLDPERVRCLGRALAGMASSTGWSKPAQPQGWNPLRAEA
jgi:DNA-binding transcriptional ArsR family regulator